MYKGIYIAASGAVLKQKQMEIITQNLANADTTGFRRDVVAFKDYLMSQTDGTEQDGRDMTMVSSISTDFSNGNLRTTGNPLDVALEGSGMIGLDGERFTRRGDLRRDQDGYLTTHDGIKVLGAGGPIQLPDGTIEIGNTGIISVDHQEVDTIMIRDFPDSSVLSKIEGGIFKASSNGEEPGTQVIQGAIESSNVDVITEMVGMIATMREFESYQKIINSFDEASSKVTNDLARI